MRLKELSLAGLSAMIGVALAAACSASGNDQSRVSGGTGGDAGSGATGANGGSGNSSFGGSSGNAGTSFIDGGGNGGTDGGFDEDATCSTTSAQALSAVDIVWVIDNSCSMGDEIDKIRSNVNGSFVPIIQGSPIDWRVVMFTLRGTGSLSVCVDPPLGGSNCGDNPPRFFTTNCEVGSTNSFNLLRNNYTSIANPLFCAGATPWYNHLRFNSTKVFVEVTDDEPVAFPGQNPAQDFDYWLTDLSDPPGTAVPGYFGTQSDRKYIWHSIIGYDPNAADETCQSADYDPDAGTGNAAASPGKQYKLLSDATGGITASICDNDWSAIFNDIANGIVDRLSCEYTPVPPEGEELDPSKVNVTYTPNGNGTPEKVLQDPNDPCVDGWQWNAEQTKIILCGALCDRVREDPNAKVDIQLGCKTEVGPPK